MDDGHVAAADLRRVHGLELRGRLEHVLHPEAAIRGDILTQRDLGLGAAGNTGGVHHVGAADQLVAHHGIERKARLRGKLSGGFHNGVVHRRELQHIGLLDVIAVLVHGARNSRNVQLVAGGGHALGDGGERLGELRKPAELHGLAAVSGNGAALAELLVHQIRPGKGDERFIVKRFHFGRERVLVRNNARLHGAAGGIHHVPGGEKGKVQGSLFVFGHRFFSFFLKI